MKKVSIAIVMSLLATCVWAQDQQQTPPPGPRGGTFMKRMAPGGGGFHMPMGPWWKNSDIVQKINLSDAQVQQIESIFQQSRSNLQAAGSALRQAEQGLQPLINTDQMNDAQISVQLDAIAQARMNLEKTRDQMLLAIRKVLTLDQWTQLQSMEPPNGFVYKRAFPKPGAGTPPPQLF